MRGERSRFPIRDTKRELASTGSSAVKTWKMSPEELEDYRATNTYVAPTNFIGLEEKRGVDLSIPTSSEKQRERALKRYDKRRKEGPDNGKTKSDFIKRIADGKSVTTIEKEWGMKCGTLSYWVGKWNLRGLAPGAARSLLGKQKEEVIAMKDEILPTAGKVDTDNQNAEVGAASGLNCEAEIAQCDQVDSEEKLRISELSEDRDQWKQQCFEARQAVVELEEERQLLLQVIERSVEDNVESVFVDNVNSPQHYTTGDIEVIDFIVAKLTEEEFTGFCKGNILKYASRANHKGGFEDIRKVKWYVDRLIEEVDAR